MVNPFLPLSFVESLHVHYMIFAQSTALYAAYHPEEHLFVGKYRIRIRDEIT